MWHGFDSGMKQWTNVNMNEHAECDGHLLFPSCHVGYLVSEDQYLHQESDPRYRGSHIPSRAFRILQNFTDSSDDGYQQPSSIGNRPQVVSPQHTQIIHQTGPAPRARPPPSEQSEPEPRKYMGGNIPSRSFRMLQAMTALDPDEGKSDL